MEVRYNSVHTELQPQSCLRISNSDLAIDNITTYNNYEYVSYIYIYIYIYIHITSFIIP
jgi:hypothetical protein